MGKKRSRRSKRPNRSNTPWSIEEEVPLLAWLDFTLKHSEIDFDETIFDRLHGRWTLPQIKSKLWRLWYYNGLPRPSNQCRKNWREDVYRSGSWCFDFSSGFRETISTAVQLLEDEYFATQLATPSRRLRSHSAVSSSRQAPATVLSRSLQHRMSKGPSPIIRPIHRTRRQKSTESPSLKREASILESSPSDQPAETRKRKKVAESSVSHTSSIKLPND
jgi:hypothetical protein